MLTDGYTIVGDRTTNPKYPSNTSITEVMKLTSTSLSGAPSLPSPSFSSTMHSTSSTASPAMGHTVSIPITCSQTMCLSMHPLSLHITSRWWMSYIGAWSSTPSEDLHFKSIPLYILSLPTDAKKQFTVPTVRDIFNHRGLAIAYNNNTTSAGFVWIPE